MPTADQTVATQWRTPKNLLELPDEVIFGVVNFAQTTDEAVNLGPETTEQDIRRIKRQLFRPFQCCRHLWNIANAAFEQESLVYWLHLEHVKIEAPHPLAVAQPNTMQQVGIGVPGNITIMSVDGLEPIVLGAKAGKVRHLEMIVPLDLRSCEMQFSAPEQVVRKVQRIYSSLTESFSALESLRVRITSYGMGERDVSLWHLASNSPVSASARPDLVANRFVERIRHHVQAVACLSSPSLTEREVWLHQKRERDWRCWRNGPLDRPPHTMRCSAADSEDGYQTLVWDLMDLSSCRLSFGRSIE